VAGWISPFPGYMIAQPILDRFRKMKQSRNLRLSISLTIASCFVGLVVVLLGTLLWSTHQTSKNTAVQLVARLSQESLLRMQDEIRNHLDPVVEQATWVASLISSNRLQTDTRDELAQNLVSAMAPTTQVTALIFVGSDFQVTRAYRGGPGQAPSTDTKPPHDLRFASQTLKKASTSKAGFWNEILFSEGQQRSFVNYVQPVWRQEKFIGVVVTAVSLNELSDLVLDISSRMNGTAFILRNKTQIIAHPNLVSSHPDLSKENPTVDIGRIGDLVLSRFWSADTNPVPVTDANLFLNTRQATIADQRYVFVWGELNGYSPTPWIVGGHADADTLEAPLKRLQDSLQLGLLIIVVGSGLAVYLGRTIARAIKIASRGISQIAQLDVDKVEPLPRSSIVELDTQARAFNNMVVALKWFSMYVPKSLVNRLIQKGGEAVASDQREVTVMFTDLAGFTSMSEQMSAAETANHLNHHFALLAACVEAEGGTIDKFMGDALMAFWGAPDEQPDQVERAVRAAKAMVVAVKNDNKNRQIGNQTQMRFRVGLHCGLAVVGNIGAPERMNYTVVGDTVNTAQRMEQLGKEVAADAETIILATENIVHKLDGENSITSVGSLTVKGKIKPVKAYRLLSNE
jgi:class 3 adenylate cyclase